MFLKGSQNKNLRLLHSVGERGLLWLPKRK
nr:MAG TPA: hypothetical protein [Caudoviricetes sp.]